MCAIANSLRVQVAETTKAKSRFFGSSDRARFAFDLGPGVETSTPRPAGLGFWSLPPRCQPIPQMFCSDQGRRVKLSDLTTADVMSYRQHLVNVARLGSSRINQRLRAIRCLCRWAERPLTPCKRLVLDHCFHHPRCFASRQASQALDPSVARLGDSVLLLLLLLGGQLLRPDVIGHLVDRAGEPERQLVAVVDRRTGIHPDVE